MALFLWTKTERAERGLLWTVEAELSMRSLRMERYIRELTKGTKSRTLARGLSPDLHPTRDVSRGRKGDEQTHLSKSKRRVGACVQADRLVVAKRTLGRLRRNFLRAAHSNSPTAVKWSRLYGEACARIGDGK